MKRRLGGMVLQKVHVESGEKGRNSIPFYADSDERTQSVNQIGCADVVSSKRTRGTPVDPVKHESCGHKVLKAIAELFSEITVLSRISTEGQLADA